MFENKKWLGESFMIYRDRKGNTVEKQSVIDKVSSLVYGNSLGRTCIKPFTSPVVSRFVGACLDSRLSVLLAIPYKMMFRLDMSVYKPKVYSSYNEFFTREIKPECRPIDVEAGSLIAPADGKLSLYPISENLQIRIKHSEYSISSLLKSKELAEQFKNGYAVVIRMTGDDYHHYCYVADGTKGKNHYLNGMFHMLHPVVREQIPVYKENAREFCRIRTKYFGELIQMEVGAMMVGRICNQDQEITEVSKGQEKGHFAYGGSTIVVLVKENTVDFDEDLLENSKENIETLVKMGERIGFQKSQEERQL